MYSFYKAVYFWKSYKDPFTIFLTLPEKRIHLLISILYKQTKQSLHFNWNFKRKRLIFHLSTLMFRTKYYTFFNVLGSDYKSFLEEIIDLFLKLPLTMSYGFFILRDNILNITTNDSILNVTINELYYLHFQKGLPKWIANYSHTRVTKY